MKGASPSPSPPGKGMTHSSGLQTPSIFTPAAGGSGDKQRASAQNMVGAPWEGGQPGSGSAGGAPRSEKEPTVGGGDEAPSATLREGTGSPLGLGQMTLLPRPQMLLVTLFPWAPGLPVVCLSGAEG